MKTTKLFQTLIVLFVLSIYVSGQKDLRVSEINFTGNYHVTTEELVKDLKERGKGKWETFVQGKYEYLANAYSRSLMYSKGYLTAQLKSVTSRATSSGYAVTIDLEEGPRFRVGKMEISGARIFSEKDLLQRIGLQAGEIANAKKLIEFVYETLKRDYMDRGYLLYNGEFEFGMRRSDSPAQTDLIADFQVLITEGRQFKISKVELVSPGNTGTGQPGEPFPIKPGDIYNQTTLEEAIANLNKTGKFQPVDVGSDVDNKLDEEKGTVAVFIILRKK